MKRYLNEIGTRLIFQLGLIIVIVPLVFGVIVPNLMKTHITSQPELQPKQQIALHQEFD